ncbi:NAD(P)/FAD-dependent oxidoreductase [Thermosynechococcaceae cyanobacterium BACA0444]|uniref:NAD(P)/FAD-dependent oxidoreductase n=1 Tax=Pseudocalidococcus azoricus BACA0444 TaxID=2918990 RepID=A0AAE4FSK1_9CYAN|nr:NAD(P)/FAD-dependent oxidoreductase [Pseudocalidococcus azoricus]MDS3861395.1 NAD(P)/FAD-dependent oxidoreductase [Pseudocalidococcus azoricus BACA0444]
MSKTLHHVVIVGGGFAGLYAAKSLGNGPVKVTLIDKRNFHLFQPLLYQVATGSVSPANISSPLRSILRGYKNVQVLLEEVIGFDPQAQTLKTKGKELHYDSLVVATGVSHHYFGNDHWQQTAPGLKTVEDALEMRRRIFMAFEAAEKEPDPVKRQAWLTFVIVGGGPTGVELAGAIAELAYATLKQDFRNIDTGEAKILLLEGLDRVLPPYPEDLSAKAEASLTKLGVTVKTRTLVTNITDEIVTTKQGEEVEKIAAQTILWAAGVKASGLGRVLAEATGASLDRVGRVIVEPDLSLPNYPNIYVIGDLAHYAHQTGNPLPGIAPVAIQEGEFLAKYLQAKVQGEALPAFSYSDSGNLAVIGQNEAVVNLWGLKLTGPLAWLIWVFAHIYYLIEFDHKLVVMTQWAWSYFTRNRGARLITGEDGRVNQDMEPLAAIPEQVGKA